MIRKRGTPRLLRRIGLTLLVAAVALELGARAVVFDWVPAQRWGIGRLRSPFTFAHPSEDLFWLLRQHFEERDPSKWTEPNRPHPQLGWLGTRIVPGTLDHRAHATLSGRRPVLLYGDSFAACVSRGGACFEERLERSELGRDYVLVNYGAGGYGVDQAYLLMQRSVDLWDQPLVVFSLYVDDDLDRAGLEFRQWPKPRLRVRAGELVLERDVLPGGAEYMEREFPPRTSWAWRMLVHSELLPERLANALNGNRRREERVRELAPRVIEAAVEELARRRLSFCFVLFHGQPSATRPETLEWRQDTVVEVLERLEVPYLLTGPALMAAAEEDGLSIGDYFLQENPGRGHLNDRGNEVVFQRLTELVTRLGSEPGQNLPPEPRADR